MDSSKSESKLNHNTCVSDLRECALKLENHKERLLSLKGKIENVENTTAFNVSDIQSQCEQLSENQETKACPDSWTETVFFSSID